MSKCLCTRNKYLYSSTKVLSLKGEKAHSSACFSGWFPALNLMNPKMRYDQEDDVLMIWFAEGKQIDHAEQVGQSILHLTRDDEPILLEILNARNFILNMVSTAIAPVESAAS